MKILVTGAKGFIGKNLCVRLREDEFDVLECTRETTPAALKKLLSTCDYVVHLAGVNRPDNDSEFEDVNHQLTNQLCTALSRSERKIPILFTSSTQAGNGTAYGSSKDSAEKTLMQYQNDSNTAVTVYRLPNVFGKWCRPHYNSVVATYCHQIANNQPIHISAPDKELTLVYIDDVINSFIQTIKQPPATVSYQVVPVAPTHQLSLGSLAEKIYSYKESRESLIVGDVGVGLDRALYSTYLSYLNTSSFTYELKGHADDRGNFAEVLKTKKNGQFSFFTIKPGQTRGGHYHHTKTEKFLVLTGTAIFRFRHIVSNEQCEVQTSESSSEVVETVPGWAHDVSNPGPETTTVMLWANEIFDPESPDTFSTNL